MRKIYQSIPDVPQAVANKAIDIIERHFAATGVRRAADLPEESRVHLLRELQSFFHAELPYTRGKESDVLFDLGSRQGGKWKAAFRWLARVFRSE